MWYIFPQIQGLGFSATSKLYAIRNLQEAQEYLIHPLLGKRLKEITDALINLPSNNAHEIFGSPDDVKLKSSMTLFASLPDADPVFESALKRFFKGEKDAKTLSIIKDE